jgi:hypothetical protein
MQYIFEYIALMSRTRYNSDKSLLHCGSIMPFVELLIVKRVWLRPVTAYDTARQLYNTGIKYNLMLCYPYFGLTLWATHGTTLLYSY